MMEKNMRVLIVRESTVVHEIKDQAVEGYGEWKYRCTRINHDYPTYSVGFNNNRIPSPPVPS
jgi:hypothetical protein